jgi:pimeloyl-ACP methyl ester carboxylesterase
MRRDLTFGLVHGAWHRAACWEPLAAELDGRGCACVAVELPADQADPGVADYAATVTAALREVDGPVVLVGHSLGGLTIPVVAARRPVALLVYLCAALPDPGLSFAEQLRDPGGAAMMTDAYRDEYRLGQVVLPDGRTTWPPALARAVFYHDCPPELAERAVAQLRPQGPAPMRETTPLASWPGVPAEYILCRDDRVFAPDWSRRVAAERLGVTARELPGGHSPFLARPALLADELLAAAAAHGLG